MNLAAVIDEFIDWLTTLPPEFAFMLAVPFIVAAAALLQLAMKQPPGDKRRRQHRPAAPRGNEGGHRRWGRAT